MSEPATSQVNRSHLEEIEIEYPTKSQEALAICLPRWEGKGNTPKVDPCGGCPLYQPCVMKGIHAGLEQFTKWIAGINQAAAALRTS